MKLNDLLKYVKPLKIIGDTEKNITGINIDSRKIEENQNVCGYKRNSNRWS